MPDLHRTKVAHLEFFHNPLNLHIIPSQNWLLDSLSFFLVFMKIAVTISKASWLIF